MIAVEFGVDPFVRIFPAPDTAPAHFKVDAIQVRHSQQRHGIHIHRRLACQSGGEFPRGNTATFKAHHDFIVSRRPRQDAKQFRWHVVGPHRQGARRLAGWVVSLSYAQRSSEHIEYVGEQKTFRGAAAAENGHNLAGRNLAQRQAYLPPQRRRHRRRVEYAALKHHGQAIGTLAGLGKNGLVYQGVNQGGVALKRVGTCVAQAQSRGNKRVPAASQVAQKNRHVGGHQAGAVHGLGKSDGLLQQCGIVHVGQSFSVDIKAGIFAAALGGTEHGVDQLQGVLANVATQHARLFQIDRNLGHHLFDTVYLNRALRQNSPDFGHQMRQKILVAQMPEQVRIKVLHGVTELIWPQPVAFLQIADHQIEI